MRILGHTAVLLVFLLVFHGPVHADEAASSSLVESGAATPSVGGDVRGEPNLYDFEFVTARLTLRAPDKTFTAVTVAPFLRPPYNQWLSELRIGIFAETSGAFGLGVAWGFNQARVKLAREGLPSMEEQTRSAAAANLESSLAVAIQVACLLAETHRSKIPSTSRDLELAKHIESVCNSRDEKPIGVRADLLTQAIASQLPELNNGQPLPTELLDVPAVLQQLRAASANRTEVRNAALRKADDELLKKSRATRLENAYTNSLGLNVITAIGWFPFIDAPKISPTMGAPMSDAYAHAFRNADIGGAVRFYFSRTLLAQARGGRRWDRANAMQDTKLTGEYYGGLDLAAIKLMGDGPDDTGFQPGIGGGLSVLEYRCAADDGCLTEIELGDPYPKTAALDHRTQVTGFVEWRARKEFQARLSVDLFVDKVKGQIPGTAATDASPRLIHIVPSISLGASFWGL